MIFFEVVATTSRNTGFVVDELADAEIIQRA